MWLWWSFQHPSKNVILAALAVAILIHVRLLLHFLARRKHVHFSDLPINEQLCVFIGTLSVVWAAIERELDRWVEVVHATGGAKHIQSFLPPSLDRELDYLASAVKLRVVAQQDRSDAERLIAETHRLKTFRHDFIHGLVDTNDLRLFVVDNWRLKRGSRVRLKRPYTVSEFVKNYSASVRLMDDLTAFVRRLENAE